MSDPASDSSVLVRYLGIDDHVPLGFGRRHGAWKIRRGNRDLVLKAFTVDREVHFLREVAVLHHIEHRGLMSLDRCGQVDSPGGRVFWYTSDFVPGGDVGDAIRASRWPSVSEADDFITGMGSVLDELHRNGVVHRDVKPANIALRDRSWSDPVLLDPGLVRFVGADPPDTARVGTVAYMAPEQLRAESAGPASDVFGLGVVLHRILMNGAHPFVARGRKLSYGAADRRIRRGPRGRIPGPTGKLVLEMLAHDPADRPHPSDLIAAAKR